MTLDPSAERLEPKAESDVLLRIRDLRTHFASSDGVVRAVEGVDLDVRKGRTLCVVGESGCGKSATALSVLQLVAPAGRIVSGTVEWRPDTAAPFVDLASVAPRSDALRRVRGGEIGMIFQEPSASLSPMYTVGQQLVEAIRLHRPVDEGQARNVAIAKLQQVGIPDPQRRMESYPFEMSGGMCQRVMISIALSCNPALLIADEPTTSLDVTTQARILGLLERLRDESGMAMLFITHDLGVVAEIADDVVVMYLGTVAERGRVDDVFYDPKHPYTRALLRSIPGAVGAVGDRLPTIEGAVPHALHRPAGCPFVARCAHAIPGLCDTIAPPVATFADGHETACHLYDAAVGPAPGPPDHHVVGVAVAGPRSRRAPDAPPIMRVRDLATHFPVRHGFLNRTVGHVRAVDGVDLTIHAHQALGLVGESGCGKTTLGRSLAGMLEPTRGVIEYECADGSRVDIAQQNRRQLRRFRGEIRVIFQDPFSSLNPRMTVWQIVGEPLRNYRIASGSEVEDRVSAMLTKVGLRPDHMSRYPHAFSGGERQRINIARALITDPRLVVADEPVSALDVSVRAQILNLLADLKADLDLAYLLISHDMSVVEFLCDRVAVMYLGTLVEVGDTDALFRAPRHPYTELLLSAVPKPDPRASDRARRAKTVADDLPDPSNPPPGCRFHTRCAYVRDALCRTDAPLLRPTAERHASACHYAEELALGQDRLAAGGAGVEPVR
ncbi:MAG TPA: ABC transporter ATP-binding protein [Acidimicrobiales bacterium]